MAHRGETTLLVKRNMNCYQTKVLLVEDNRGDARLVRESVSESGCNKFTLLYADCLSGALQCLGEDHIDVILLDLSLPDSQGLDTFVRIHDRAPEVPTIVLTGLDDETCAVEAVRQGAQDYLCKGKGDSYLLIRAMRYAIERKQAEEKEKALQQELNLANRLASIGALAAGVAHEINNPLTGIIGFSELLMRKDVPDDVKHDLELINGNAQRVARIVKNLLAFARQSQGRREYADINYIISRVIELYSYEMKINSIEVTTQEDPNLPATMVDVDQLQQVFLNIIANAKQAMKQANDGGKLAIKIERVDNKIRASFSDNGPGIAKENLDRIFDPFFTTKGVGEGSGLGLSISYGIINEHKGMIFAESELGKGASFIVELPITDETQQLELTEQPVIDEHDASVTEMRMVNEEATVC